MITAGIAFGERVALMHRVALHPDMPARLLMPGDGLSLPDQARSARFRPDPEVKSSRRNSKRVGGRTSLTPEGSAPPEILLPGIPDRSARVRARLLGVDPAAVDSPVARRLGFVGPQGDFWRYEMVGDLVYWRGRLAHLSATAPGSELLALLEERPEAMNEPVGTAAREGVTTWRAQSRLDSMAARQKLISALLGDQYADAAELAAEYPAQQEFLSSELALALEIPESLAGGMLSDAFALSNRLPGTLAAFRAGRITQEVATVMVGSTAVVEDPAIIAEIERLVLPNVAGRSRESVRREICRHLIRLDPDRADARHKAARKLRTVSKWGDVDGMGWLKVHAPIEDIAAAWEALTGLADAAKTPGDDRTLGQRRVDVFTDIFHGILDHGGFGDQLLPTQHGRKAHIGVLIPYDVLFGAGVAAERAENGRGRSAETAAAAGATGTGVPATTPAPAAPANATPASATPATATPATATPATAGVCELVGFGPIAPSQGLKIAAGGVWRRIVYDPLSGTLLDYGTTRYEPPESLKRFVVTRDQECPMVGCAYGAGRGQIDHAVPFSKGGATSEFNLCPPCPHHHRAKDGGGWTLVINDDRSKTWTSPLGRKRTKPATKLAEPRTEQPISRPILPEEPAPF